MGGRGRRCVLRGAARHISQMNQIRLMSSVNGVDRIVNGGVHEGKAAGRVNGCRLSAMGADEHEQCFVPLQHRVSGLVRGATLRMMPLITRIRALGPEADPYESGGGESEALHDGAPPEMSVAVRGFDVRGCELPAAL